LSKILSGEYIWCQGFSEPGAGSDLASLRTEARLEGEEWIINGHKIWTSMGMDATHMFALVRTDKTVRKQAGITMLLFEIDQPGITIQPIKTLTGAEEFAETFLVDVRARADDVVNGVNNGWRTAQALLGFERIFAGSPHIPLKMLQRLDRAAALVGRSGDPVLLDRIAQAKLDVLDLIATYERCAQVLQEGKSFGPEVSVLKIWATETSARISEMLIEVAGESGGMADEAVLGDETMDVLTPFLEARAPMIYGGTVQIHHNMLAKAVLNLPSE
jgi:alkylation response protein AidB-like acyl-CoA dehydrogenase